LDSLFLSHEVWHAFDSTARYSIESFYMDFETVSADDFGASLTGIGVNLLVRDVRRSAEFLSHVFGMTAHRVSDDFAIMQYQGQVMQLHADRTFGTHPMLGLVPELPPRGAGAQFYLFQSDPDAAVDRAKQIGADILELPTDKPHGLREACILCPDGYVWSPACALHN